MEGNLRVCRVRRAVPRAVRGYTYRIFMKKVYTPLSWTSRRLHQDPSANNPLPISRYTPWQTLLIATNSAEAQPDSKAYSSPHPASVANLTAGRHPVHSCNISHLPFLHRKRPHQQSRHSRSPFRQPYNKPRLCNPRSNRRLYDTWHNIAGPELLYSRDYLEQQ